MKKSLLLIAAFSFGSTVLFADNKAKEEPVAVSHHVIALNHYKDGSTQIEGVYHNHYAPEKGHVSEKEAILFSDRLFRASKNAVKKVSHNVRPVERNTKPVLTQIVSETPNQQAKDHLHAQIIKTPVTTEAPSSESAAQHVEPIVQHASTEPMVENN